jgi:hypothetical protein
MTKQPGERPATQAHHSDRRARLARALRSNLQKRKAQTRARAAAGGRAVADDNKQGDGEKTDPADRN